MMKVIVIVFVSFCLVGCASTTQAKRDVHVPGDTITVAASAGYDYESIFRAALDDDRAAIRLMLEMSTNVPFDGASSEGHAESLGRLFREVGEIEIASGLSPLPRHTRMAALDYLLFDMTDYSSEEKQIFLEEHRHLAAVIR